MRNPFKTKNTANVPLRIAHTVSSLQVGGMEQFVLRMAKMQQEQGHEVHVIALTGGPLAEEARKLRVPVRVLSGSHKAVRAAQGLMTMAAIQPDIIHAHNPTSLHYAMMGKLVSGAPVVMTDHGQCMGVARNPSDREWSRTDAVVAVSNAVAKRRGIAAIEGKTSVIPNGVEPTAAHRGRDAVRRELGLPEDRVVAIIAARLVAIKGHETLLRALAELKNSQDPKLSMTLLIAGDGPHREAMEALAGELGLDAEWVRFLGFRLDVPDLLEAADFFVLPSLAEGLPLSVLEAMSHRLPVIATPVDGIPEVVVEGETGLLVPTQAPAALAAAISRMIQDETMRRDFGEAGYQRVHSEFSFEQMVRRYGAVYSDLCDGR
jgi:glycosyltransferase involved in cell wall biosynthesis